jgi:polar amino acid transport system substrate-binding protein
MTPTTLTGAFWAAALCALCQGAPAHAQTLTVAWRDKAPQNYVENGVEKGPLLARARQVFAAAGIDTRFVREPTKRIWANLQGGVASYCSFGWYYLAEREAYAQFSQPFHVDPPHTVLLAPQVAAAAASHTTLASLLADKRLTLGVVDGVSYGSAIDALIKGSANQVVRRTVEPATMMRMVSAARVSFMFIDRDDLAYFRARDAGLGSTVQHDYPDMPPGLKRYIVCSKDVAGTTMARINKAIDALDKPAPAEPKTARKKAAS